MEALLEPPPFPESGGYLWEWFWDLSAGRRGSPGSADPLTWAEMDAWARLRRLRPAPFEIDILRALDRAFLNPDPSPSEP